MLSSIRDFFDRHMSPGPSAGGHSIELATAALLVEVARIDRESTPAERAAVEEAIQTKFGLRSDEAAALIDLAEQEVRQANDYFQFTSLINRYFSQEQKVAVIEQMWRVAYSDSQLSAHENHLLRKVADLLHVPHGDYIAAKMRAQRPPA